MRIKRKIIGAMSLSICAISLVVFLAVEMISERVPREIYEPAFSRLEEIRASKKQEIISYIEKIHRIAKEVNDDPIMVSFFTALTADEKGQDETLDYMIDEHWARNYPDFYDILFVNSDGTVFHSIRRESDYRSNLFHGPLSQTKLAREMRKSPAEHFVDYEHYAPSGDAAAFFATPVLKDGAHAGWFVLQFSSNHLNAILSGGRGFARTGEVYLVNKEQVMLTDSRFLDDTAALKLRVDTRAVQNAMKEQVGKAIIDDYRGVKVLSAYERFEVLGVSWIVVAEIDREEIVTDHYLSHAGYYNQKFSTPSPNQHDGGRGQRSAARERVRVDVGEFGRVGLGRVLETYGVATCTAVAISYPGKFAYLAHIGPEDVMYRNGPFSRLFERESRGDILESLIHRIKRYDVYPYELRNLEFTIVTPHDDSFANIIERLLESGVELGGIKLIYNPLGGYANVLVDPEENVVTVVWGSSNSGVENPSIENTDIADLDRIVRRILDSEHRSTKN